jgi:DNA-binding LacI/PurR family transcriptional regulator
LKEGAGGTEPGFSRAAVLDIRNSQERSIMQLENNRSPRKRKPVTLKTIADRVGLAPCSISAVLNNTPAARGIPQHTKDRVLRAASQLKYQPNFAARSLRTRRTHSVAVVTMDWGSPRVAPALAGIEQTTRTRGYQLMVSAWDGDPGALADHLLQLRQRGVEGLILIDVAMQANPSVPVVLVETDDTPRMEGGIADGRHVRARGEAAAKTLVDQIEAFARVGSSYETMFWRTRTQDESTSVA